MIEHTKLQVDKHLYIIGLVNVALMSGSWAMGAEMRWFHWTALFVLLGERFERLVALAVKGKEKS